MKGNSEKRNAFTEELVELVSQLVKKHGLQDLVIHRDHDPMMIAARGCLDTEGKSSDHVELVVQVSDDLRQAESLNLTGARLATEVVANAGKAFDLSQMVAHETVTGAAPPAPDDKDNCP
ncbi:MAG: hypothetical protein R3292_10290 [Alcanivorax sp.]|nr:hypothetical protein [Alcanivorax sp.]